ncbi:TetR/AcrR family transcriptional regulator C-terminal domain-containing protein [Streptomyces sp. NPDC051909]|uniref:TetR/AcrR family transcriptional regulator C-terminal domain-containing protein n=1 Tax=Streptomyces sp. NPDC051909 TaxID=3154944 RepID=UPI003425876A
MGTADDLEERAGQETGLSGDERRETNEPRLDAIRSAGSYPLLKALTEEGGFVLGLESLFEFGLRRTLDGIAVMIGETFA